MDIVLDDYSTIGIEHIKKGSNCTDLKLQEGQHTEDRNCPYIS